MVTSYLVHEPLVEDTVLSLEKSLVGGVNDDGVAGKPRAVKVVEDSPDIVVYRSDRPEVYFHTYC